MVQLSQEVAEKFAVSTSLKGGPRFDCGKWGIIDFSALTLDRAEQLVKKGFPHLVRKSVSAKEIPKQEK